ncbi:FAR1-related sequence 5-like protein [Tanacetum coccineum]
MGESSMVRDHDMGESSMVWDHDMGESSMVRDNQVDNQIVVLREHLQHPDDSHEFQPTPNGTPYWVPDVPEDEKPKEENEAHEHKRSPNRIEFIDLSYQSRDGSYIHGMSKEFMKRAREEMTRRELEISKSRPVDDEVVVI